MRLYLLHTSLLSCPLTSTPGPLWNAADPCQRNLFPAAVQKDKHSRSGLVKSESQRKQGAGAHNWGSFSQEGEYENMANTDAADERAIFEMEQENADGVPALIKKSTKSVSDPLMNGNGHGHANTDVEGNKDIAHSPSDSMSSLDSASHNGKGPGAGQRRMSNVSDEERDRARVYREGVMNKGREYRNVAGSLCS